MILTPNEPFSGDDASIIMTEDDDDTYHMELTYDGGDNRLYVYGKNNANFNGPHFGVNRDNGRVGIGTGTVNPVSELEVVGTVTATAYDGDGSGVTNVTFEGLTVNGGATPPNINTFMQNDSTTASNRMMVYDNRTQNWGSRGFARVAFHASASVDQTIGDTAYNCLNANNSNSGENFEDCGGYEDCYYNSIDNTNSGVCSDSPHFNAPVDGIYFFEAAVLWDNSTNEECRNAIFIRVNNTDEVGEWSASGGLDFFGTGVSTTLELNQGDQVAIRVYNGASVPMDTFSQSGKHCYFSGFLIYPQE